MPVMMSCMHYDITLTAVRMGVQVAGFARRHLLSRGQLFAGHFFVNLLDLRAYRALGVTGDAGVGLERGRDLPDRIANLLRRLFGFDQLAYFFAQRAEIFLLII